MGDHGFTEDGAAGGQRKEIYTYKAPWTVFSMSWSKRQDPSSQFRLAIGSYVEQYSNCVTIVKKNPGSEDSNTSLYKAAEFDHPYPCTKIMWNPDIRHGSQDLIATTGDYLRVWSVKNDDTAGRVGACTVAKEALLNNNKYSPRDYEVS